MAVVKKYGISDPLNLAGPSANDLVTTATLETFMRGLNLFDTEEESLKREEVLSEINDLIQEWIFEVGVKQGMPENIASSKKGQVHTFGSYRLGVHGAGADIDALCISPAHVGADCFFVDLQGMLFLNLSSSVFICVLINL